MDVRLDGTTHTFDRATAVRELLKNLHLNPETYLVSVNGELVTTDHVARPGDDVRIIRVVSGG